MSHLSKRTTNKLLGYPDDARLLIINADDFGMCHAVNKAIAGVLKTGLVRSATLMVPCAWALHAMRVLRENPDFTFGIHLTVIGDGLDYRWGPVSPKDKVPSLVDEAGYFYNFDRMAQFRAKAKPDELEIEFRAQIEAVLAAGLKPTHLDWHSIRFGERADIPDLMFGLAKEYGLALRVLSRPAIEKVQSEGLPTIDYDFLDSSMVETEDKPARYAQMLRELPAGLSERAVHPGIADAELQAIEPSISHIRQADFAYFMTTEALEIIRQEGIILLSYEPLQAVWRGR
jgi:predicted glycoside hydrolase/deacetylase ChbG (UPF0249 family)